MTVQEAAGALSTLEKTPHAYQHAMSVLNYDGETVAPRRSAAGRGQTMAVLAEVVHGWITAPRTGEIIDTLLAGRDGLDEALVRRAELLKEDRDELTKVPADEYAAYQRLLSEAGAVWHDAKARNDYPAFAPYLDRIIDYNRRLAERKDAARPAYDVLLDTYEKGASMAMLDPFFSRLRDELTPVVAAVAAKPQPDTRFLSRPCPIPQQRAFTERLMALMGIDPDDCAVGETEHPFTDGFNKHDVRITTHYYEDNFISSMYSVIHEGGHALYELGVGDEWEGTLLAGGSTMGIHESQSRFYENLIGRSRPFCEALMPILREVFPEQMAGVDAEALYRAVNVATPSLIRTEADELTYPMHILVRYELEKAMMDGALTARDVPGAWNEQYRRVLGVEVPDDRQGCLQDTHWAGGMIGYFPSYALGSAYGVQMLEAMQADVPVWERVAAGDLAPVTAWLREKIHRHGRRLTPAQLLENAVRGPFDPERYIRYLKDKYTALYGL